MAKPCEKVSNMSRGGVLITVVPDKEYHKKLRERRKMKLRNKKTGEIKAVNKGIALIHYSDGTTVGYNSLAELNEEWEDYGEPKTFWYIRCSGEVYEDESDASTEHGEKHREIGNYFETKEEAERAVEKLKAWKRLKDKGFRFKTFYVEDREIVIRGGSDIASSAEMWHDLDLLFSPEED